MQVPGRAAAQEPTGAGAAAAGIPAEFGEAPGGPENGGERKRQYEHAEEAPLALETRSSK